MNYYELIILTLSKNIIEINEFINFYKNYINKLPNSKILFIKNFGNQKLSYKIKNYLIGNYTLINIKISIISLLELKNNLKYNNSILRILITKIKKNIFKYILYYNSKLELSTIFNLNNNFKNNLNNNLKNKLNNNLKNKLNNNLKNNFKNKFNNNLKKNFKNL